MKKRNPNGKKSKFAISCGTGAAAAKTKAERKAERKRILSIAYHTAETLAISCGADLAAAQVQARAAYADKAVELRNG